MDEREDHDQSRHCVIWVAYGQRLEHRSQKGEDEGQEEEAAKLLRNLTTVHLVTVECPMNRIACHQYSQSAHADGHIRVFPIVQVEERRLQESSVSHVSKSKTITCYNWKQYLRQRRKACWARWWLQPSLASLAGSEALGNYLNEKSIGEACEWNFWGN